MKNNKGFTLVELIVVIAILGVLMAVLVPQYIQYVEKSRIAVDESMLGEIAHNMEIGAATTELDAGATYTITLTPTTAENETKYAYTISHEADGGTALLKDVDGVIPAKKIEFKSKEYQGKTITISMKDGKVQKDTSTGKLWS